MFAWSYRIVAEEHTDFYGTEYEGKPLAEDSSGNAWDVSRYLVSPASSTSRMVPIAASSFPAISRLERSSRFDRTSDPSSSSANRAAIGPPAPGPRRQFILVPVGVAPALDGPLQRIQRRHQPARGGIDIGESPVRNGRTVDREIVHGIAHDRRTLFAKSSAWSDKLT